MKKLIAAGALVLLIVSATQAETPKLAVGAFAGVNIPVLQQDQGMGTAYGAKASVRLMPMLALEPHFTLAKWGDPGDVDGVDLGITGSKVTSFGLDAVIGKPPAKGLGFVLIGGVASYKVENEDTGYESSKIGFAGGLGLVLKLMPMLDLEVRGKALIAPQEEGGSKKAGLVTGGLTYHFGGM